jgi:preprotein translocase subunit YajC
MPFYGDDMFVVDSVNLISKNGVDEVYMTSEKVKTPPGGGIFHPADNNKDGIITICLDRNYGDCDYPMVGYRQVQIPLKGYITFPFPVNRILNNGKTYVKLVEERGGPREMAFGPFINWLRINPNDRRQVLWDVPQNYGIFNGILFQRYEDVDFFLSIDVELARPGRATEATTKISSLRTVTTPTMPNVPKVQIVYSCLAKGTKIMLADGKTANIEDIAKGSKVVADGSGVALSVEDVSVGIERIPMVRIEDDAGRKLLLTASHPVLTPDRGVIWAEELAVGSKVLTKSGASTLVKVKREMYRDNVYNLKLDTSTLAQKTFAKGSTMFANGFLVGDLSLQKAYEFKNSEDRSAQVLQRIPASWHTDYQNSLKLAAR